MLPLICSLLTTCIPRWNRVSFSFWSQMIRAQKKVSGLFPMLFNSTASPPYSHSSRLKCRKTPAKLSRLSPPIRRICCFCRIAWPAHSIRPPFPLKSCLFGIYFTVNCSQMHKSTAKAEFYFFGSALAAIFSDDLYITSFSSSTNVSGSSSLSMENQRRTAVRKASQKNVTNSF